MSAWLACRRLAQVHARAAGHAGQLIGTLAGTQLTSACCAAAGLLEANQACCLLLPRRSDGDPAVCSKCADGMAPDPATSLCTPCRQAHARQPYPYCSETDATRCGDGIWDCADGYFCQNVTGQCMSCVHPGCETCSNGTEPGDCTACLPGWWDASRPINEAKYRASPLTNQTERSASFQDVPTECKPCGDPHCLVCDISHGASCERCADGFFLDRKTKLCRSVGLCCRCRCRCCWVGATAADYADAVGLTFDKASSSLVCYACSALSLREPCTKPALQPPLPSRRRQRPKHASGTAHAKRLALSTPRHICSPPTFHVFR